MFTTSLTTSPTASNDSAAPTPGVATQDRTEARLRTVLATNASTSGLGGLAALVLGRPVDELLGAGHVPLVRLVGAGLVAFAAFVLWTARAPRARLIRDTPAISAGDAVWVVGTVVTVTLGWYSTRGAVVMGLVAAMVATFGALQAHLVVRLRSDD